MRKHANRGDHAAWIFELGLCAYLSAFLCWLADMFYCELLNPSYAGALMPVNPQLHAWWHVLVSCGLYNMALLTLVQRMETKLGRGCCCIRYLAVVGGVGIIPYVHMAKDHKAATKRLPGK